MEGGYVMSVFTVLLKLVGGLFWLLIGLYCCWIFAALLWNAARDPKFRKDFFKTSDGCTSHSLPMTCALWSMMFVLYAFFIYIAWLGGSIIVHALT